MKHTIIISSLVLFNVAYAAAGPPDTLKENILARAHEGKNGVIVAVTERGDVAADTAWLLSAQIKRDNSHAPLFLALNQEERESTLKALKLSKDALPALIFYDHDGREVSRVIGALPTLQTKQARNDIVK